MLDLETQDDEAAWNQMMQERQQQGEECAKRLAQHIWSWQDLDYLCHMAGISSPYERKDAHEQK